MNLLKASLVLGASLNGAIAAEQTKDDHASRELRERIINGVDAPPTRYPYTVSFQDVESDRFHFCGGSLIAPDIVLCAAHCAPSKSLDNYQLVVNPYKLNNGNAERMQLKSFVPHPDYNSRTIDNDYMIIKLTDQSINPIVKLNTDEDKPRDNTSMQVMGWGTTENGGGSNTLQEVDVITMTNAECKGKYSGITDSMLCALEAFKGSCQGDSGGPLIIPGDGHEEDVQVGIVSWGIGCADPDYPGVYARVSEEFGWIKGHVCNLSANPPAYFGCGSEPTTAPDTQAPAPTPSPIGGGKTDVFVQIKLDEFPDETSWKIKNAENQNVGGVNLSTYDSEPEYSTTSKTVSLDLNGAYTFLLKDSWGDGFQGKMVLYLGNSANPNKILGYYDGENSLETFNKKRIDFVAGTSGITGGPPPMPDGVVAVVISVTLDFSPEETSWKIRDLKTSSFVEGASIKPGFYADAFPGDTVENTIYLPEGGRYKFILKDSYGDGLEGHVTLYSGGAILGSYTEDTTTFSSKHTFKFST